jgi:hypothetical protein
MSEEVAQVLLDIGLGQHVGALIYQEHVIDLEKLKLLDEDKMKDIGMPFEDQRKIRLWIRACETFDIVSNKEGELDLKRLQIAFASLDLGHRPQQEPCYARPILVNPTLLTSQSLSTW